MKRTRSTKRPSWSANSLRATTASLGLLFSSLGSTTVALANERPAKVGQQDTVQGGAQSRTSNAPLELGQYLMEVLDQHPKLLASRHKVAAAEGAVMSASGAFDLKLYASGSHYPLGKYDKTSGVVGVKQPTTLWGTELWAKYENGSGFPPYDGDLTTSEWGKASVGLLLPILQDGSIDPGRYAVLESKIQKEIAEHFVRQTQSHLLADAAHSWWKWYILGHKVGLYDAMLDQAEERQSMLEELVRAGSLAPLETVDNQRTILSRQAKQAALSAEFKAAGFKVGFYRRDNRGAPRGAHSSELPVLPEKRALSVEQVAADLHFESTPIFGVYQGMLSAVEQELQLAKNQQLPRLDLSLAATHSAGDTRPYSSHERSTSETTVGGKLLFSLDVQRRKARGKAQSLRAKQRQIEAELQQVRDSMQIEVLSAHQMLVAQHQVVQQSHEATALAQKLAQAEAESLLLGQSTVMNVNIREQAVLSAQLDELEALHLLQSAWIELQRARGSTQPEEFILQKAPMAATKAEVRKP